MPPVLRGTVLTLPARARAAAAVVPQRVLLAVAGEVVEAQRQRWPVKTGRSRAALVALLQGRRVVVRDPVSYATAIVSGGRRPWPELVAALRAALRTVEARRRVASELVREVRRGR